MVIIKYFFWCKLIIMLISPRIHVFRCDTGTRYILVECRVHSDCNAPDPNKMYKFKRDILLNVLNIQIAT